MNSHAIWKGQQLAAQIRAAHRRIVAARHDQFRLRFREIMGFCPGGGWR